MIKKILLAAILLAFFAITPALAAPDMTYSLTPFSVQDDNGLKIYFIEVKASDMPAGSYGGSYNTSDYRFYTLYYSTENTLDTPIRWQYDIRFVDNNSVEYGPAVEMVGSTIAARFHSTESQPVEYMIPKNATGLYLRWYHIDKSQNEKVFTKITLGTTPAATPTPTPKPTTAATPTPTAVPTATAKPAPADGFLPLLAISLVASGFVLARSMKK